MVNSGDAPGQSYCKGGGGLAIFVDLLKPKHLTSPVSPFGSDLLIELVESNFEQNRADVQGGGIMAYSLFSTPHSTRGFTSFIFWKLYNVTFFSNSALYGSAGYFKQKATFGLDGTAVLQFKETTASNNFNFLNGLFLNEEASVFELIDISSEFYGTNTLSHNIGSALHVRSSIIFLFPLAQIIFSENTAHRGAGANFEGSPSSFFLLPNTHLEFNGNKALVQGGAVYTDHAMDILQPLNVFDCFIGVIENLTANSLLGDGITVSFSKNYAPIGSMIYGSTLETCPWAEKVPRSDSTSLYETLYRDYNSTFIFDTNPVGQEFVSTLPMHCLWMYCLMTKTRHFRSKPSLVSILISKFRCWISSTGQFQQ